MIFMKKVSSDAQYNINGYSRHSGSVTFLSWNTESNYLGRKNSLMYDFLDQIQSPDACYVELFKILIWPVYAGLGLRW